MDHEFNIGDLVLYKNNQLIAFNKPAGIAVQEDRTGDKALINLGEIYAKSTLFPLHRIDRPASGLVLFAKNKKAAGLLGEQFKAGTVKKTYLAVIKERPEKDKDRLIHFLRKDGRTNKSFVENSEHPNAKEAILEYNFLASTENYHLLEINLLSGRHHQIRAQLAAEGFPVKGDVKYGFRRKNKDRSIHLHAWKLSFDHPVSGIRETIIAPFPDDPVWQALQDIISK